MMNVRRLPGYLYRYKARLAVGIALGMTVMYLMHHWGIVCTNREINREIEKLCNLYKDGKAVGSLCQPLCEDSEIHSISCVTQRSAGYLAFTARWNSRLILIKTANAERLSHSGSDAKNVTKSRNTADLFWDTSQFSNPEREQDVETTIRNLVAERLNLTLTLDQLDLLRYLNTKTRVLYADSWEGRTAEIKSIFQLLQSQEYLLGKLFADREVFPQVLGTCGHLYGVEYLDTPNFNSVFTLDDKSEWSERMKLAIAIMDFVEIAETEFPDALYFCDFHMEHLGVTRYGRIKFLEPELVFSKSIIDSKLKTGRKCEDHRDCDLYNCRSFCSAKDKICDAGVANDNLQAVCERIFIGWTMPGKTIIPGLLMSDFTPASLSALLRLCAENRRQAVPEDLRQRLYTILTEMHQILTQRLLSE
ncbi:hypothetical protein RUM43_013465 [Polyplax serrata]|uniref:FAM69 N-terminal domain-containing protein n=1 Tax=Polyplax serrata TaxID=468196 RepID=A0AAN8Q2T8_POLSC